MPLPSITFVTGNKGKLTEVQAMLSGIADVDAVKVDLPELQGDPLEVAKEKAVTAFKELQRPCMVEDTSLCFHALNDLPGPYIKWFLEKCGHEGLNKMLDGFEDRAAHAMCIFTVAESDKMSEVKCYVGVCQGTIVRPRGPGGFGWDPVFCPKEGPAGKTFAEMTAEEKNAISHRKRALDEVKKRFAVPATTPADASAAPSDAKRARE